MNQSLDQIVTPVAVASLIMIVSITSKSHVKLCGVLRNGYLSYFLP